MAKYSGVGFEVKRVRHVFELIGKTPMVRINKMNPNPNVEVYAKLEGFNPMGSLKDRIALRMIEKAEEDGRLTKDKIILEATSGNTGISVAWVAAQGLQMCHRDAEVCFC